MSEKRYYWLKLKEDFFEDDIIEYLKEQENGAEYILFYLMLCLKSLKSNGILVRNVGNLQIPYDAKKLADITGCKLDTVVIAMQLFQQIGIVSSDENGVISLPKLPEMVGSENSSAARKRKSRENKKKALTCDNVTSLSQLTCDNVTERLDIDKELRDRVKSKSVEIDNQSASSSQLNTSQSTEAIPKNLVDVQLYAFEKGYYHISYEICKKFYNYYSEKGWIKGTNGKKITDWRNQFEYWISREAEK